METLNSLTPELWRLLLAIIGIVVVVFGNALVMGYLERKLAGHFQCRTGPMEVGFHGILQLIVDGVKLMGKQLVVPAQADKKLFMLAPMLSFAPVFLPLLVIPFSDKLQGFDLDVGLLFILAIASINVLAILVGGWGSNNKYSLFGAFRSVAQNVAYEIPMLIALLAVVFMTNTFSLRGIVEAQNVWFVFLQPVAFLIYLVAMVAETNRAPFDLPEAESELTAGFHTEYSGMGFSLFMIAEYTNMFIVCSIATVFFLGGTSGIPLPYFEYTGALWFFAKVYLLMFFLVWIRWTYPRTRFDQLMNLCWKYLIPFSLINLLITVVVVKL
ncbi:NADH-quinone oxidoreductase subunit NuoH [Desulfuromonas thiophila]|uniref:NADH-quinone oxidoreductase subunit H n=1 Tax=Desulfuromonas thiophila TaxID=57664 RepID=A0A1G7DEL7_9BACT|nr:NADH-quinone oxidoreductase subunit NuoH [Desulfuromonas thiophila]MDD3802321.1 NADH-quinone oxidoreductase subunit NuoH [Desulfuromonas thiophila]MDY0398726.1 NADH-quinone oxidoreductase subunit NuoH [Desulfuromonas thiophila]SDE49992.1 NADH dehydrogenase subunit H [Desulfuromonas thiophila]